MLVIAELAALMGATLALRFRVLILVPASVFICVAIIVWRFGSAGSFPVLEAMLHGIFGLQLGYLLGAVVGRGIISTSAVQRASWPWTSLKGRA